jgi:PQQ-dependent dehydrogenase (methanol/ethanol family)
MTCQRTVALACFLGTSAILLALGPADGVDAQEGPPEKGVATFTEAQAAKGKIAYAKSCSQCHGQDRSGGEFASSLEGPSFTQQWGGKTAASLFTYIRASMPPADPGGLGDETYTQILAYILQGNGARPGNNELPSDPTALAAMRVPEGAPSQAAHAGPGGGLSPLAPPIPVVKLPNPLDGIRSVTDELLQSPPAQDWLSWRRTYDDFGFSPLTEINKNNVSALRVAWSWSLPNGPNEATPLEHDGVLFVDSFGDHVQSLNAATGDLLWEYSRALPGDARPSVKRDLAIYREMLLVPTSDDHLVALDVRSGNVIWDHEIIDYRKGWRITGGPLVAKGMVMQGIVGQSPGGDAIVGLDFETGEEKWRFRTIAQPGEPGGDSWNGLPLEQRSGASVWTAGSYDPQLNLAYFGTGQTYDTGPLLHPANQPGITNDALYTDSTLAFNPDTGKLVWYYQHMPNDQWDLDWAFERQLITMPVNGAPRKLVVTAGKEAIYDALDAATGQYVFSKDLGIQNVVVAIDPKTGAKKINPGVIPGDGNVHLVCPHSGGGRSWIPTSYNPGTKILYTPMVESCMDLIPAPLGERGNLSSGVNWHIRPRPETDGNYGRVEALNLETKNVVWIDRQRAPQTTGVLATAGGVVFAGALDRNFTAYDDANGKILWQVRLNDVPSSCPITYGVNGKQYVAVVVGNGGAQALTWPPLVPEIHNPPGGGAAVWVFELPEKDLPRARTSQ